MTLTSSPPWTAGIPPARFAPRSGGFLLQHQPPPLVVVLRRFHRRLASPCAPGRGCSWPRSRPGHGPSPHVAQVHWRTPSGLGPSLTPQAEHTWLVGSNRPTLANVRPYRAAFSAMQPHQLGPPASATDLASRVRIRPDTARSSA